LPNWLSAIVGQLGLSVQIAERLGAEPGVFQVVQLAVALVQQSSGQSATITVNLDELLGRLNLRPEDLTGLDDVSATAPAHSWDAPAERPLLADLLELALENRRQNDAVFVERLEREVDMLHRTLADQQAGEEERLRQLKMAGLAEMAAG